MVNALGVRNPLRYRGYVYDTQTRLYYLQSRYYDPEIGRFINADIYTSTGQGLLGNNMFAYCGNSPASRADFGGHAFVQIDYNFSDHLLLLCPALGGGAGGGGGGYALTGISSSKDFIKNLGRIKDKTLDTIGSVAEYCWDAYMHEYNRQQNAQMQETRLMMDGAIAMYTYLDETGTISATKWGVNTYKAARHGKFALAYIAAPIPTQVDECFAAWHTLNAVYFLFKAGMEVFQ